MSSGRWGMRAYGYQGWGYRPWGLAGPAGGDVDHGYTKRFVLLGSPNKRITVTGSENKRLVLKGTTP